MLISKWTKAFGEGYVISKTLVKRKLLLVVNDYFKKCIWSNYEKIHEKRCPQIQYDTILIKEITKSTTDSNFL